jgi:hypothetical protein
VKTIDIDTLLGDQFPEASFHDSELKRFDVDLLGCSAQLYFDVPVASKPRQKGGREYEYRPGILKFDRLLYFAAEPPRYSLGEMESDALWITADGSIQTTRRHCRFWNG